MEDVDGWELLAGDGSLEGGKGEPIPREVETDHGALLDASYFICPASPSHPPHIHPTTGSETALDPMAVDETKDEAGPAEEIKEIPVVDVSVVEEVVGDKVVIEENKFVDMKVADLPEIGKKDLLQEAVKSNVDNDLGVCESVPVKEAAAFVGGLVEEEKSGSDGSSGGSGGGFGIWGWRVTGLGALCSLGVAAATICIILLGRQRQMQRQQQSQKFRFNSCGDESCY
ncbi:uncharacterized protein LOC116256131 isoform X2 [Nymphaea colorata]|uniref:uncharacterized protein LOC116256131 isoform X2 n=1 Tax=Nymphaea colorata TaxID=210225 RepID=UPI00129DD731|nr:uncharacterized protein LOC116256131 isoform X2 [Nymphaea colorata]